MSAAGSGLDVKTAGAILARGPLGEATLATSYGDIRIERADRIRLKSTYGDISVTHASGPAEVTTTHGGIHIGRVDGAAAVRTSHGAVRIGEVTGELRLNSAHGDITVDRPLAGVTANATENLNAERPFSLVPKRDGGGMITAF